MAYKRFTISKEELLQELQTDKAISDTDAVLNGTTDADLITTGEVVEEQEDAKAKEDTDGDANAEVPTDTNLGTDPEVTPDNTNVVDPQATDPTPTDEVVPPNSEEDNSEDKVNTELSEEDKAEVAKENLELTLQADPDGDTSLDTSRAIGSEIEEFAEGLDCAQDITHALECMQETLKASLAFGGLKPKEIPVFRQAVEAVCGKVTLPTQMSTATESFTPSQRIKNTQVAMEWLREKVAAVWKYIMDLLEKIMIWINDKMSIFFSSMNRNQRTIENIRISLKNYKIPENNPADKADGQCTNFRITKTLFCSSLPVKGWKVEESIEAFSDASKIFYASVEKSSKFIRELVTKVLNTRVDITSKTNVIFDKNLLSAGWQTLSISIPGYDTPTYTSSDGSEKKLEASITKPLPGGTILAAYTPPKSATLVEGINAVSKSKIFLANDDLFDKKFANEEIYSTAYLTTPMEFSKVLSDFETINNAMKANLSSLNEARKDKQNLIRIMKSQYQKALNESKASEADSSERLCGHLVKALVNLYDKPVVDFSNLFNSYTSELSAYLIASVRRGL